MIKKISIALFILLASPLVIALFLKSEYHVEKSIVINQPKEDVFAYLVLLKNQDNFSKWAQMDPNMVKSYRGTDGQVGFVSRWESENPDVGVGEQEIMKIDPGKRIDFQLRFYKPFEATDPAYITTEQVDAKSTTVKWGFSGHMDYPTNILFLFMDFEKIIGDDLQTGLNNLKVILEKE